MTDRTAKNHEKVVSKIAAMDEPDGLSCAACMT